MDNKGINPEYIRRIYLALNYIDENLAKPIRLDDISRAAAFSQYHFHRIFKSATNESLWNFILRLRLERAAILLISSPEKTVTSIALDCGFTSSATFARAFKKYYGISATSWRKHKNSKIRKASGTKDIYLNTGVMKHKFEKQIKIEMLPDRHVAYSASLKGYADKHLKDAYNRLYNWASPKGLIRSGSLMFGIGFDNPEITPTQKCRYYVCLEVPENVKTTSGSIGLYDIDGGKHAVLQFKGTKEELASAYNYLYSDWLPASRYLPGDSPPYEIYRTAPGSIIETDICIPIKRF